jgi:hypothetical protein
MVQQTPAVTLDDADGHEDKGAMPCIAPFVNYTGIASLTNDLRRLYTK